MFKTLTFLALFLTAFANLLNAQKKPTDSNSAQPAPQTLKKANRRAEPKSSKTISPDPFDKADVAAMAAQCVKLETEAGVIELEMFPESAPESVRNFLNLSATGAYDTTVFNRVVPGFIVQGGDLSTRLKMTAELDKRMRRNVPDEPSLIKHERGIISMARASEPNSATTNFFILVGEARHLDGTFAAFGRVTKGMEVVETINKMPVQDEKPTKPARISKVVVAPCPAQTKP